MVTQARLPVLWLCGAPATGKSTVTWQVFSDLAEKGLCVGYLDIDQIGMLQPPPDGDPTGHRFKVDNLAAMVRNYRTAGAQVLVISGVIDPGQGPDFAEASVDADITFCHLTVDATNEDLATLRHAVRPAPVRVLRLAASPEALWERILARSAGGPARLINDDLENATHDTQRHVHRVAVGQNAEYAASSLGDDVIDTSNLLDEEAVEQAVEQAV